ESPLAFIPTALSRSPRIELSRTIHIRGETRGLVQHVVSAGAPAFLPSSCSRARAPTETTLFVICSTDDRQGREGGKSPESPGRTDQRTQLPLRSLLGRYRGCLGDDRVRQVHARPCYRQGYFRRSGLRCRG